jgi:hypothetical protein
MFMIPGLAPWAFLFRPFGAYAPDLTALTGDYGLSILSALRHCL